MLRTFRVLLIAVVLTGGAVAPQVAEACPMCKVANEDNTTSGDSMAVPRAYMYSILFMLSMPATLFAVFGISLYRLSRKREALNEELLAATHSEL